MFLSNVCLENHHLLLKLIYHKHLTSKKDVSKVTSLENYPVAETARKVLYGLAKYELDDRSCNDNVEQPGNLQGKTEIYVSKVANRYLLKKMKALRKLRNFLQDALQYLLMRVLNPTGIPTLHIILIK